MIPAASNPTAIAMIRPSQVAPFRSPAGTSSKLLPQASQYGASEFVVERQTAHCFCMVHSRPRSESVEYPRSHYDGLSR